MDDHHRPLPRHFYCISALAQNHGLTLPYYQEMFATICHVSWIDVIPLTQLYCVYNRSHHWTKRGQYLSLFLRLVMGVIIMRVGVRLVWRIQLLMGHNYIVLMFVNTPLGEEQIITL